ncbi:MAG: FecR domain-containing protein [Leptonema sp. (in: Bacteria)]|nr:FecR domain-containing protein [Leptonema sp. (in: bacteria)]
MRLSKSDITITIVVLLIVAGLSFLLHRSLNQILDAGSRKPIGKIIFKERVAQRRFSREPIWENLRTESLVYHQDTIRTENLSEAEIVLNDGTSIALEENTLIVLNFLNDEATLDFSYGGLRAASGEGAELKVRSGDAEVDLSGADARLSSDSKDDLELMVTRGRGRLDKNGKVIDVGVNEVASVGDGDIKKTEIAAQLQEPANGSKKIVDRPIANVAFQWQANQPMTIEIARTRDFRAVVSRTIGNNGSANIPLAAGLYFWRAVSANSQPTPPFSFTLIPQQSVVLHTPYQNQSIPTQVNSSEATVQFSWSKLDLATSYDLVISSDPAGANVIRRESSTTTLISVALPQGQYFWQVIPKSTMSEATSASAFSGFSVSHLEKLPPPLPIAPAGTSFLKPLIKDDGVVFTWKSTLAHQSYSFQISTSPNFNQLIVNQPVSAGMARINQELPDGHLFWRLVDSEQTSSGVLDFYIRGNTEVTQIYPILQKEVLTEVNEPITFQWQGATGLAGGFRLIVSNTANFGQPIINQFFNTETAQLKLDQGLYYWKVAQVNEKGQLLGESRVESFQLVQRPAQVAPVQPIASSTVDMTKTNQLAFSWKPVVDAVSYQFKLYKEPNHIELFKKDTNQNQIIIDQLDLLDTGNFSWSVSVKTAKQKAESKETITQFQIKLQEGQAPEFISPDTIFIK